MVFLFLIREGSFKYFFIANEMKHENKEAEKAEETYKGAYVLQPLEEGHRVSWILEKCLVYIKTYEHSICNI